MPIYLFLLVSIFCVVMSIFGRLFACAKTRLSACIFFLLLQKSRSASPHVEGCCITVVHGWTGFYSATSLTKRQTRYQALYTDIQRLIADTASILCRCVQTLTSLSMLGREFACRKLTALTGCQWFHAVSSFSQGKTRSNQMYMDVYLVAIASVPLLNTIHVIIR